ncbi:MAG: fatty acid desaturase [Sphingobacteriales bacterium]|nr:MAG: fatty acid desaturase [Sphingobacteriales bacterium]
MLEGKELILATKPFAKEIRWKSWYHTITTLLLLVGSVLGTFLFPFLWARILSSVFAAMMLSRFFIIFHDFQHHTILHRSKLANVIFTAFGVYMITPPSIWKRSHDHHHSHNSKLFSASIGSYPIMTKQKFLEASRKERFAYLATRHPLNMLLSYFTMFLYGMCIQSFISSPRRHWDSAVIVLLHVAAGASIVYYFGFLTYFLAFFLPFFLSHMLGAYLFYAQHNFPGVVFRNNKDWNYAKAALESSSYMKMNGFLNWVTANIGYHHVHHLNSKIPFYRLPEVMARFPELQQVTTTSLRPKDIVACLKLKVWDPERSKMITSREIEEAA